MKLFVSSLAFFALSTTAGAEVLKSSQDAAKEAHMANINALLIFTSQDGLNSGLFRFTKVDADMRIFNFPFLHHFKSQKRWNYFVVGNVGYSRVTTTKDFISVSGLELASDTQLQTYTGGIGGGVRYEIFERASVMGGLELIYSRSGVSLKQQESSVSDPVEDFFGQKFNDNISYKLFFEASYEPDIEYFKPYVKFGYKFFDTKSDMGIKDLTGFTTQSSLFSIRFGGTSDPLFAAEYGFFTLGAYLNANYLAGDVVKSVDFEAYSKVGTILHLYHNYSPSWIERYFLEVSTINTNGLEGYNVGLGFSLNF